MGKSALKNHPRDHWRGHGAELAPAEDRAVRKPRTVIRRSVPFSVLPADPPSPFPGEEGEVVPSPRVPDCCSSRDPKP